MKKTIIGGCFIVLMSAVCVLVVNKGARNNPGDFRDAPASEEGVASAAYKTLQAESGGQETGGVPASGGGIAAAALKTLQEESGNQEIGIPIPVAASNPAKEELLNAYDAMERNALRRTPLFTTFNTPKTQYVTFDDMRKVDPREKEARRLYDNVVSNHDLSWEARGEAAAKQMAIEAELTNDPDFVLFKYARQGKLYANRLHIGSITSREARERFSKGEPVFVRYIAGNMDGTRKTRDAAEIQYIDKLLQSQSGNVDSTAKALGLPREDVQAIHILRHYETVGGNYNTAGKLKHPRSGLHEPGRFGKGLDILGVHELLRTGNPVEVRDEHTGETSQIVSSFKELADFCFKDAINTPDKDSKKYGSERMAKLTCSFENAVPLADTEPPWLIRP